MILVYHLPFFLVNSFYAMILLLGFITAESTLHLWTFDRKSACRLLYQCMCVHACTRGVYMCGIIDRYYDLHLLMTLMEMSLYIMYMHDGAYFRCVRGRGQGAKDVSRLSWDPFWNFHYFQVLGSRSRQDRSRSEYNSRIWKATAMPKVRIILFWSG